MRRYTQHIYYCRIHEILMIIGFGLIFACVPQAHASEVTQQKVLELVNESRLSHGLEVIAIDSELNVAAHKKAEDMFERQYFSHNTPDGTEPWYWIEKEGYAYKYAGENLAISFTDAEKQHAAWMKSPTHRKNILNPVYKDMGVAVERGEWKGDQTTIVVQFFGQRITGLAQAPSKQVLQPKSEVSEIAKGVSVGSGSLWDRYTNTATPLVTISSKTYDKAIRIGVVIVMCIVLVDMLILSYIQIRNMYPIIKRYLRNILAQAQDNSSV